MTYLPCRWLGGPSRAGSACSGSTAQPSPPLACCLPSAVVRTRKMLPCSSGCCLSCCAPHEGLRCCPFPNPHW